MIGILSIVVLGCKPARPKFAMPEIAMLTGENLHSVIAFTPQDIQVFGNYGTI